MIVTIRLNIDLAKIRSLTRTLEQAQRRIDEGARAELARTALEAQRAAQRGAQRLPRRGGLSRRVAASNFDIRRTTRPGGHSVSLVVSGNYDLRGIDAGRVVHPTFGHRPWVSQSVPRGWFSVPVTAAVSDVDDHINSLVGRSISLIR